MRCGNNLLLLAALLTFAGQEPARAQLPTYAVGRAATPEEIAAWNIAIGPDGRELPPGRGSAKEGAVIYAAKCAMCHGVNAEKPAIPDLMIPLLVGGRGTLKEVDPVKTIGSFWPYATSIWDTINRAMPLQKPESLAADEVYALTAYLLYRNDIIKEDEVMDQDTLPKVEMPNRHGFFPENPQYKPGYLQLWFWAEPRRQEKAKPEKRR